MYKLTRIGNVPGNDLGPDEDDMKLIKTFDSDLVNTKKWERLKLTGLYQGTQGVYGYCKNENNNIEFYFIEMYLFQSAKSLKSTISFRNIYIIHQIDENSNLLMNDFCLEGGTEHPLVAIAALKEKLNISPKKELTLNSNFEQLKQSITEG